MENIFDFNPTSQELEDLFGAEISKDDYLKNRSKDDERLGDIYSLLVYRDEIEQADKFWAQIADKNYALSLKETFFGS